MRTVDCFVCSIITYSPAGEGGVVRQSQTKDWQVNEENLAVECFNIVPTCKV